MAAHDVDFSFQGRAAYARRLEGNPRDLEARHALASIAAHDRDYATAEGHWRHLIEQRRDWAEPVRALGQMYLDQGRVDEAVATLAAGVKRQPASVDLRYALGLACEDAGDRSAAESHYRQAMQRDPNWGAPLGALLMMQRASASDDDLARADALVASAATADADRALTAYGVARVREAREEYPQAAAALEIANGARRRVAGAFDREQLTRRIDATIEAFDQRWAKRQLHRDPGSARPIFVVGMPRSGTTLTERVLAAHPNVTGYGESPALPALARRMPELCASLSDWPAAIEDCGDDAAKLAAQQYLDALALNQPLRTPRFVDKLPFNFLHIGLAATLFPAARFVVCRRHPRDVAISIFAENFAASQRYATDLGDIGHYWGQFERLMQHWAGFPPLDIHCVDYERLTADPATETRALVAAVGEAWDDRCLRFFEGGDAVQTPSRWQVRQPVYRTSVGRWERFAPHLPALFEVPESVTASR